MSSIETLNSVCVHSVTLYGVRLGQLKKEDVIRLKRNDARMVSWMHHIRSQDKDSGAEFRTRIKLNSMRECLQV